MDELFYEQALRTPDAPAVVFHGGAGAVDTSGTTKSNLRRSTDGGATFADVMRSADNGQHWQQLPTFYNGSLFGVIRLTAQRWVTYGMRGHVFVTDNFGEQWQAIDVGNTQPLYGHVLLPDNAGVLIVGAGSSMVRLDGQGRLLGTSRQPGLGTLTSAIVVGGDQVLVAGERGVYQGSGNSVAALGKGEQRHETR